MGRILKYVINFQEWIVMLLDYLEERTPPCLAVLYCERGAESAAIQIDSRDNCSGEKLTEDMSEMT
jgi:hypothetical protein